MINKIYQKSAMLFVMVIFTTSCTKLDFKPTDMILPEYAFRNITDINLGVIGAYAPIDYSTLSYSAIVSDEATYPAENTVGNSDAFRWLYTGSNGSVTGLYYTNYQAIDRVNRVLEAMDKLVFTGTDIVLADRYRGELLGLRAYLHFELLRAYAAAYENGALGVTYMEKSAIIYPARDNFEVVIAKAKADLIAAKALIPVTFTDKTRMTRLAISAIQARVALYEKNWGDAAAYATEVINAVPLATKVQFPGLWTDANDSEVIWKLKRVVGDSRTGDFFFRQSGSYVLYAPSFKLIAAFDQANDIRYPAYVKFDATRTGTKSKYLVNKYIGGTSTAPGLADVKQFRVGEMYLIRAEARAESTGDAAADINALRGARIDGYVNANFANKSALITAVYDERFKELALEGHRFFDLRRRKMDIVRLAADAAGAGSALTLTPSQAQYALPIPATEMSVNKNAIQNPHY
ncbi:MAG: RagB/SusD family nutrient uptake outer membrane protein [Candidatus Pedobacter colombiensis]|uniref:RagB/SusD family nutrient uptake outer membrane protein n=1 Tax=Candidatus Pedobacter colombiensis TaxID=3121371 RepID=A0AAJ6B794_9SPHI|nr:RagB/SusD family nutrient uptake outer membrane protein [Pedobacter sp.]WEK20010.1 MAG: RagB/SusD family nutrient uptake outer membrane protein [Pedobacter sp.]